MKIVNVKQSPFAVAISPFRPAKGRWSVVVVCKASYRLQQDQCELLSRPEPISRREKYQGRGRKGSAYAPNDLVFFKPHPELMLVGSAFAPLGRQARSLRARIRYGRIDKTIEVHAERTIVDGNVVYGQAFRTVPLIYENAAKSAHNPIGVDVAASSMLPRLLPPDYQHDPQGSWPSVGFGPISWKWPERRQRLGPLAERFNESSAETTVLGEDFNGEFFQHAPRDQWLSQIKLEQPLMLDHLNSRESSLSTRLPKVLPRMRSALDQRPVMDIPLTADTLWIDTDRELLTVCWRGRLDISRPDEDGRLLFGVERADGSVKWPDSDDAATPDSITQNKLETIAVSAGARGVSSPRAIETTHTGVAVARPEQGPQWLKGTPSKGVPAAGAAAPARKRVPTTGTPFKTPAPTPGRPSSEPPPRGAAEPAMTPAAVQPVTPARRASTPAPRQPSGAQAQPIATPQRGSSPPPRQPGGPQRQPGGPSRQSGGPPRQPGGPRRGSSPPPRAVPLAATPALIGEAPAPPVGRAASFTSAVSRPPMVSGKPFEPPNPAKDLLLAKSAETAEQPKQAQEESDVTDKGLSEDPERAVLQLVWHDEELCERVMDHEPWQEHVAKPPKPAPAKKPRRGQPPAPPPKPESAKDAQKRVRTTVSRVIRKAGDTPQQQLAYELSKALREDDEFNPPLCKLGGELVMRFDPCERLKLTTNCMKPLSSGDKKLMQLIDQAEQTAGSPLGRSADVSDNLTGQLREAWGRSGKRPMSQQYLDGHIERLLLEDRGYYKLQILGGEWLVARLALGEGASEVCYLPEEVAKELPLLTSFTARVLAEVVPRQDANEHSELALKVIALAREIELSATQDNNKS